MALAALIVAKLGLPSFSPVDREPPAYYFDDPALVKASGTVRILDRNGTVRYRGDVEKGVCTGQGQVFNVVGQMVYEGPLVGNAFEGQDAKMYRNGVLIYSGEMAGNHYEGQGVRVDPETGTVSEGQFSRGMLEGEGEERSGDGRVLRTGAFSRDLLNGEGKEFGAGGILLREGNYENGLLHGEGKEYTETGAIRYDGQFRRGVYQGQGKIYDITLHTPVYEGEFRDGIAVGLGRIYHTSGQLLYEGIVYDCQPRADAFLGLSLAEVEDAFKEHWVMYVMDGVTAFVYPYFHLMFITESPIILTSRTEEDAKTEQQRQELLEALAKLEPKEQPETGEEPEGIIWEVPAAEKPAADESDLKLAQPATADRTLPQDTAKADIIICEVLSYAEPLPGAVQPDANATHMLRELGWREYFSDYATYGKVSEVSCEQAGPFIYTFTVRSAAVRRNVECLLAESGGVQTATVERQMKDGSIWYQSAMRRDAL